MSGEFPDTIKGELIKGFDAKDDGNYELALEAFTNVINSSDLPASRKPQILSIRSSLYADMGMNYNSYCDACQGLELDPQELQCLSWKSKILENCGNLDESKDVLLELSQISSEKQILYLIKRIDYKKNLLTNCPPLDCEKLINRDIELQSMKLEDVKSFMLDETEGIKCNPKKILEIINGAIVNIGTETKIAKINTPKINIVGGIEGKVGHLTKIFEQNGWPSSENKYLFNGNIIGQNSNSLPLVISLLLFKFIEKDCIFFNQGAYESPNMRKIFGFRSAALGWYGQEVADALDKAIDSFPFCTIVNDKYFVINGGIPVSNDINVVASPESYWGETSNTLGIQRKAPVSYYTFGPDVVNDFLSANKFELLIRSGQKKADGFQYEYDGKVLNISSGRGGTRVHKSGVAVITGDGVTPNSYDLNPRFPITVHAETDSPGLTGIFYKLRHDFDIENPMDLNLFYVKSSSPIEDIPPVETVVSSTYSFGFMTYPTPGNSHIAFIFKGLITVEAYTIESAPLNKGNDHMKTWKLLGTNDGKTLEVIDERSNVNELNGPLATATFKVKDPKPYKMLILLQHEKNHRGNWNLCLNHIDFFGTLQ